MACRRHRGRVEPGLIRRRPAQLVRATTGTLSIAIGAQNNLVGGPGRTGPRNDRRSPSIVNTGLYPALMWNGRFLAPSGDPFDNSPGFVFAQPEGTSKFSPNDPVIRPLLVAQAYLPPTELKEMAGLTAIREGLDRRYSAMWHKCE